MKITLAADGSKFSGKAGAFLLKRHKVAYRSAWVVGYPTEEIVNLAKRERAPIVMGRPHHGSKGRGNARRPRNADARHPASAHHQRQIPAFGRVLHSGERPQVLACSWYEETAMSLHLAFCSASLGFAMLMTACAAPPIQNEPLTVRQGVIEQITPTMIQGPAQTGVGAVVGGVTGAALGSLVGGGTGRDVAMVAGALGGAVTGSRVASNAAQPMPGHEIFVRTDSGVLVEVTQPATQDLRVGQRVFIQGSGESARVTPQ